MIFILRRKRTRNTAHLTDTDEADFALVLPPSLHQFSFLLVLKATFKKATRKRIKGETRIKVPPGNRTRNLPHRRTRTFAPLTNNLPRAYRASSNLRARQALGSNIIGAMDGVRLFLYSI